MTTLPPESSEPPPATAAGPPHLQRQVAEGFGADASRYDRARPTYPAALVDRIVAASPGREVVDVGCGTGISSRLFEAAGCRVLGVEPDPRMAEQARQGGTEVEIAKFEDWDPAGRAFDAVVAAQAWHWVDLVAGAAKRRRRCARAAGSRCSGTPSTRRASCGRRSARSTGGRCRLAAQRLLGQARPRRLPGRGGRAADGMRQAGGFGEPEEWLADWARPYTRDEWLDLVPTLGGFRQFPPDVQAELLAGLGAAVDAAGGAFLMGYTTLAVTAVRLAP